MGFLHRDHGELLEAFAAETGVDVDALRDGAYDRGFRQWLSRRESQPTRARASRIRPGGLSLTALRAAASRAPRPLPVRERHELEVAAERPLGDIRVHSGSAAAAFAEAVSARALAIGRDIYFGAGQLEPSAPAGRHLLGHEVGHAVSQGLANVPAGHEVQRDDANERGADDFASHFAMGAAGAAARPAPSPVSMQLSPTGAERQSAEPASAATSNVPPGTPEAPPPQFTRDEIVQGGINDCFLLAALLAVGQDVLQAAVVAEGNHRYRIRLFERDGSGPYRPVSVSVEGYRERGDPGASGHEWVRAMERRYGMLHADYASGGSRNGGTRQVFEHLTGRPARQDELPADDDDRGADAMWTRIRDAVASGQPVVVGTSHASVIPEEARGSGFSLDDRQVAARAVNAPRGIFANHAYAVTATRVEAERRILELHTTWSEHLGHQEGRRPTPRRAAGYEEPATRQFDIDFETLRQTFARVVFGDVGERDQAAASAATETDETNQANQANQADDANETSDAPAQRRGGAGPVADSADIAQRGLSGASARLPHYDRIQRAFGRHRVDEVRVASDSGAHEAGAQLGALAYASGDRIALTGASDLFTVAHEAAHVVQQREGAVSGDGVDAETSGLEQHADSVAERVVAGESAERLLDDVSSGPGSDDGAMVQRRPDTVAGRPEDCATYEMWIASFGELPTFGAREGTSEGATNRPEYEGRQVIGERAERNPLNVGDASPGDVAPRGEHHGDRYVDHPTRAWLEDNLAPELLRTAYELPSDCADISFILRHVWLTAHGRSEVQVLGGRTFHLGVQGADGEVDDDDERRDRVAGQIAGGRAGGGVSSASMAGMVAAYADDMGQPILSREGVLARLHPGDLLVWEHVAGTPSSPGRSTGGHVQTVQSMGRGGSSPSVQTLQGNQPLFEADADSLREHLGEQHAETPAERRRLRRERARLGSDDSVEERRMRNTPGRRIERAGVPSDDFGGAVWTQDDTRDGRAAFTRLIAAGPPRSAQRPAARGPAGMRGVYDWVPALNSAATPEELQARLEGALAEARSVIEGGDAVPAVQLQMLGTATARRGRELSASLPRLREVMRAFAGQVAPPTTGGAPASRPSADNPRAPQVRAAFNRSLVAAFDRELATDRPAAQRRRGSRQAVMRRPVQRQISLTQWPARLQSSANTAALLARFRQCVLDIEQATPAPATPVVQSIGQAAGNTLWRLATATARSGTNVAGRDEHFNPLHQMRAMVRRDQGATPSRPVTPASQGIPATPAVPANPGSSGRAGATTGAAPPSGSSIWRVLDDALNMAGRGAENISGRAQNSTTIRILVSGFDPFVSSGAPGSSDFNPSGAAALALDGQSVGTFGGRSSLVESVVYPVSFAEFTGGGGGGSDGIVERVVRGRAADFDAVITVSMGMSTVPESTRQPSDPSVEIERYAIGSHATGPMQTHATMPQEQHATTRVRIPPAATGRQGEPVIESNAPVDQIGAAAGAPVDSPVTFGFPSAALASQAVAAYNAARQAQGPLPTQRPAAALEQNSPLRVVMQDLTLLQNLAWSGTGGNNRATFDLGGQTFSASVVRGPGGSFLSNEVSYRTQRTLQETHPNAANRPDSFHVHTATDAGGRAAVGRVVAALRRVLTEVASSISRRP